MNTFFKKMTDADVRRRAAVRAHAVLFGSTREKRGLFATILLYFAIINIALVYIAPVLSFFTSSLKSFQDVLDPTTQWIPKHIDLTNFTRAFERMTILNPGPILVKGMTFFQSIGRSSMLNTIAITLPSAALQVFFCSVAGYAFGRMDFPFRRLMFVLLIIEFVVPPQAMLLPLMWTYRLFGMINTPYVFYAPSLFGHGLKGALFVFIYMQFFNKMPKELEEAAMIDGVGPFRIFYKIMMPMAKPAYMVVFLFSLVYHWTDSVLTSNLMPNSYTLTTRILNMIDRRNGVAIGENRVDQQTVQMAAGVIMIAPLIILYFFAQKTFTESIERTGLVE